MVQSEPLNPNQAEGSGAERSFTAKAWFSSGERVPYDPDRRILFPDQPAGRKPIQVFRRVETGRAAESVSHLTTFLSGFPDGSFGWARVVPHLPDGGRMPKIYVEYVGQGDSDKPRNYPYGVVERADLVEAHWRNLSVRSTYIVSFDFSSLVTLELLSRQIEKSERGERVDTAIKGVLLVNGGLFADSHSHPWFTTPLLKTPMGRMGTWFAQRSKFAFRRMVGVLWSREYRVTRREIEELFHAITRRNGAAFMSRGAGFIDEHKANAERWDLGRLYRALHESVSFCVVGSEKDPFEYKQVVKARERLGNHGLDIRMVPGGHLTTSEHPGLLGDIIREKAGDGVTGNV